MGTEELKLCKVRIISYEEKSFEVMMEQVFTSDINYISGKSTFFFKNYFKDSNDLIYGEAHKFKLNKIDIDLSDDMASEVENRHNPLEAIVRFIIFSNHTIVISSKQKFNSDMFIKMFDYIFSSLYPKYEAEASISYMKEDDDIFSIIRNFKRLVEVEVKGLKKSNPSPKPTFKEIEDFMKKVSTDVYSMKMVSYDKQGLDRSDDGHTMSAISLSNSGYADKCEFIGEEVSGDFKRINIKDLIIGKRVEKVPDEDREGFINSVVKAFHKYVQR